MTSQGSLSTLSGHWIGGPLAAIVDLEQECKFVELNWRGEAAMRRGVKVIIAGLVLLPGASIATVSHPRQQLPDSLPAAESGKFALAAMRAELEPAYRKRGLGLDFSGSIWNPHFYSWSVIPSWGQGVVNFEVDRRTGDVWTEGCERIRSRRLAALQAKFRRRFNVSAWQVRKIEQEGFPNPSVCP